MHQPESTPLSPLLLCQRQQRLYPSLLLSKPLVLLLKTAFRLIRVLAQLHSAPRRIQSPFWIADGKCAHPRCQVTCRGYGGQDMRSWPFRVSARYWGEGLGSILLLTEPARLLTQHCPRTTPQSRLESQMMLSSHLGILVQLPIHAAAAL